MNEKKLQILLCFLLPVLIVLYAIQIFKTPKPIKVEHEYTKIPGELDH